MGSLRRIEKLRVPKAPRGCLLLLCHCLLSYITIMLESRFPGLSFSDRRLKLRSRESFCNEGLSFLALLWGFNLLLKIDRRDLKFGGAWPLYSLRIREGVFSGTRIQQNESLCV